LHNFSKAREPLAQKPDWHALASIQVNPVLS
jgi:hypothetical protein